MTQTPHPVYDLRSALALLRKLPGQLLTTDIEVDPMAELSGVYRHVGAGGTVERPTKEGPAMLFQNIKGHPDAQVVIGLLASRTRVGHLLSCDPKRLGFLLKDSVTHPIPPVVIPNADAKCQEVVHLASDPDFDIRTLLPAPTNTPEDAGPYITLGMCYASNPDTGESDVTIHRMCLQSRDEISIFLQPGARHIGYFRELAEAKGEPLPISISIGVDPAIEIASCFEPPTTPLGYDELQAAGAIRKKPVELVQCLTVHERAIANAEYVIEGEILPNVRVREDQNSNTGKAMPEFPGYCGPANPELPIIKVRRSRPGAIRSCRPVSGRARSMSPWPEFRPKPASLPCSKRHTPEKSGMSTVLPRAAENTSPSFSSKKASLRTRDANGRRRCSHFPPLPN